MVVSSMAKGLIKVLQCHKQAHLGGYYIYFWAIIY